MIRTFSYRRYSGTPKLDDRINDYHEFIGDKIFSKIVSAYFGDVVDYLKHCSFDPEITIAIVTGVVVPKLNLSMELVNEDKHQFIKLLNILNDKFNWIVSAIKVDNKDIEDPSIENLSQIEYPEHSIIEFDIKPRSFESTKLKKTKPEFDYDGYDGNIYLFHVTDRSNVSSITKNGLIPKESKSGRFIYSPLVHLLRYLGGNIVKYINGKVIATKNLNIPNPVILRVGPLKGMPTTFLLDPSDPVEGAITNEKIDPKYIKVIEEPSELLYYFNNYELPNDHLVTHYNIH